MDLSRFAPKQNGILFYESENIERQCPYCEKSKVSIKEWPNFCRRVVAFSKVYYIFSCRYRCEVCVESLAIMKKRKKKELVEAGLGTRAVTEYLRKNINFTIRATFFGWSQKYLGMLPENLVCHFPALTSRSGLDKEVIRVRRENAQKGVAWRAMARTLNRMQASAYTRLHYDYALSLKQKRHFPLRQRPPNWYKTLKEFGGKYVSGFFL